ncbi:MAG: hypothetical protein N5P05_002668 [Chroococcopsis gigantea SAG 12.99]|jgi:serine/threonine protein phosphatase PrpC|nr:protein phosphatase 2C domain-containing protein [Chlorogloea purpurea SAG 13.99]MDV3001062.1 hypothetical protein [Chroococcopsis gigantea SAG 12.99]
MTPASLVIREGICFILEEYCLEVIQYIGTFTPDVHSFKVNFFPSGSSFEYPQEGLLRVSSIGGGLQRELTLREALGNYAMVAELLATQKVDAVEINTSSSGEVSPTVEDQQAEADGEVEDYLEEEFHPEVNVGDKLLLLTLFPTVENNLESYLDRTFSIQESLSLTIQICQFFCYAFHKRWCFIDLNTKFVEINKPLKFYDLSTAYSLDEETTSALVGTYTAPELQQGAALDERMSTYSVAALLYQLLHQRLPHRDGFYNLYIEPVPLIYQLLKLSLSISIEERFCLTQLLSLLITTRKLLQAPQIVWTIATHSTIGLSTSRLQNEDNYGIKLHRFSGREQVLFAVVADGMGGMAMGEKASQLAVTTILGQNLLSPDKTVKEWDEWLKSAFVKANRAVTEGVKNGGTTLSAILALNNQLLLGHVGDSRIYHLRGEEIKQLSRDHTMVAMLLASGEITEEDMLSHSDRNVLTRSLGDKLELSEGYVQTIMQETEPFITLKDKDIILLCSDGVWDLIPDGEMKEIFLSCSLLQDAVDLIAQKILERVAGDNATLLAFQCNFKHYL